MTRDELGDPSGSETKNKVKYDRQIIATAKVNRATTIYSDDARLRKATKRAGLQAIGVHELPLKPDPPQGRLPLGDDGD